MNARIITSDLLRIFCSHLIREEKSTATVEKYLRDTRAFRVFAGEAPVTKELVMAYKKHLQHGNYAISSINSMLASLNSLLTFLGWSDCRVKTIKLQKQVYCTEEKELSKSEYARLQDSASGAPQLQLVMKTICSTGIRVSELIYFTAETAAGLYPKKHILHGPVFLSRNGKPLNRSAIFSGYLCQH